MAHPDYPHLFEPLDLGFMQIPNRAIMGSMHSRLELMDNSVARECAYYAERARGEVGLIVTGGYAPNEYGGMDQQTQMLQSDADVEHAAPITEAVHAEGGLIAAQILHAGRYANLPETVGASTLPTPINKVVPRALEADEVEATIEDFVNSARRAKEAGFDGIEIMGSEGYIITQFTCLRTNDRTDDWGGSLENRIRFPVEIVRRSREVVGEDFLILYRISALDLVEGGLTGPETEQLAKAVEAAGANILSSGIGWHEARIPTIAQAVPRGAWSFATRRLKDAVDIPVVAANRINTPDMAEAVIARGDADFVAMARPMLADPHFVKKAKESRADEINSCIACNQACLDYIFAGKATTCLVNPRAGREFDYPSGAADTSKSIAVVGSGPAGLATATSAAERGHRVTLFEAADEIGGQLNLAKAIPGKDEFNETIRYFRTMLAKHSVDVRLSTRADASALSDGFDHVVIATGVVPRTPDIPGTDHPSVISYIDVLNGTATVGEKVVIMGAGGIGFDVAHYLTHPESEATRDEAFLTEWGVDASHAAEGGLTGDVPPAAPKHQITMLQRSEGRFGRTLGLTTGWVLRIALAKAGVKMIPGAAYEKIDDAGLHATIEGETQTFEADTIILCTGQEPLRDLEATLAAEKVPTTLIGGAEEAAGLDALRAIDQGIRTAYAL